MNIHKSWFFYPFFLLSLIILPVPARAAAQNNGTTAAELGKEAKETWHALENYTAAQRDQAASAAQKQLTKLDAEIAKLQNKIDQNWQEMSAAARQQARKTLAALTEKRRTVAEWYGGMKHSSADAWDTVKKGFVDSYDQLEKAFQKAHNDFQSK